MSTTERSNIFGDRSSYSTAGVPAFSTSETTAAGKLIDRLKYIADIQIDKANGAASWLSIAGEQGQNETPESIVNKQLEAPAHIDGAALLSGWTLPTMPALPSFPTLPENLRIDFEKLKGDVAADIVALQNSWLARYLPAVTDVSALDSLAGNVLNGAQSSAALVKLNNLEADTKAALTAITSAVLARMNTAITTTGTNLSTNFTTAQAGVADALALANDGTQDVAWNRGRSQLARESARLEAETISNWASRGFSLPGGAVNAQIQKQRQASLAAASEMAAKQAEKTQEMFFNVARASIDAWLRNMEVQANAEITSYRTIVDTNLRYSELELNSNQFKAKQAFDHLGLTLDFTKFSADLATKYRLGVIEGMNNLVRAYASLIGNEMEYIGAIARSQREAYQAIVDYYRAAIGTAEIGLRTEIQNNENDIRFATMAAQFIGTAVGHHVQAAGASADVFARIAGMALSGLNGIASVATQS